MHLKVSYLKRYQINQPETALSFISLLWKLQNRYIRLAVPLECGQDPLKSARAGSPSWWTSASLRSFGCSGWTRCGTSAREGCERHVSAAVCTHGSDVTITELTSRWCWRMSWQNARLRSCSFSSQLFQTWPLTFTSSSDRWGYCCRCSVINRVRTVYFSKTVDKGKKTPRKQEVSSEMEKAFSHRLWHVLLQTVRPQVVQGQEGIRHHHSGFVEQLLQRRVHM